MITTKYSYIITLPYFLYDSYNIYLVFGIDIVIPRDAIVVVVGVIGCCGVCEVLDTPIDSYLLCHIFNKLQRQIQETSLRKVISSETHAIPNLITKTWTSGL